MGVNKLNILSLTSYNFSGGPRVYAERVIKELHDLGVNYYIEKIKRASDRLVWSKHRRYKKIGKQLADKYAGKVDLVHALGSATFSLAGLEASKSLGVPYVISVHGLVSDEILFSKKPTFRHRIRAKILERIEKSCLCGADAVLTFSNLEKDTIERKYGSLPIYVIYHGSDHVPNIDLPTERSGISYCKPSFRKGVDIFLEIARKLPSKKFLVFGYTRENEKKLSNVIYHRYIESFRGYCMKVARTHLMIHPSRHDSFCLGVLEAMRLGVIPIVSENTGVKELMNGVGEVLPLDVEKWVRAVQNSYISCNEEDRKKAIAIAENYTWKKSAQKHLKVYIDL